MARRGRPIIGKTGVIRVPEDVYLMVTWIADAERRSAVRVAEDLITQQAVARYLELLPRIKVLKKMEDERAKFDERPPIALPGLQVMMSEDEGWVPVEEIADDVYEGIERPGQLTYRRDYHASLDSENPPPASSPAKPKQPKPSPKRKPKR